MTIDKGALFGYFPRHRLTQLFFLINPFFSYTFSPHFHFLLPYICIYIYLSVQRI